MTDLAAQAAGTVWQWRDRTSGADLARRRAAAAARRQGLIGLAVGLTVAGAFAWFGHPRMAMVVAGISVVLALVALLSPGGLYPRIAAALEAFGRVVGTTITWILMTLAYLLLFLPVGLLLRATGKLRLQRAYDSSRASYWQPASQRPLTIENYRRQF